MKSINMAALDINLPENVLPGEQESVNFTDEMADKPGVSFHSNPQDRAVLKMMTAIRSTLSCVSKISVSGKLTMCEKLLKNTIQNAIRDKKVTRMPQHLIEMLEEGVSKSESSEEKADAVWYLRSALDSVYDEYVDMYCGVKNPRFNPIHKTISNVISLAIAIQGKNNLQPLKDLYLKTVSSLQELDTISDEAKKVVCQALEAAKSESIGSDAPAQVKCLREALDFVYNEVRLPELHDKPSVVAKTAEKPKIEKEEILIDFTGERVSSLTFTPKVFNDTVMGGKSESEFTVHNGEGIFNGTVSAVRDGGFASVKFHPSDVKELQKALSNCIGLKCVVKNLTDKVQRFKLQLTSLNRMRAFNYQSEIVLPPSCDFTPVFLHISTFWPTMFGHVLANQGTVDVSTVDVVGIIVSRLTDNGKPNPDFREGQFAIAIKCIKLVR